MSIFVTMVVKPFDSQCSAGAKNFLLLLQQRKIAKANRQVFFKCLAIMPKKFSVTCAALYKLKTVAILMANTTKSLKFYCFESVQNTFWISTKSRKH